MLHHFFIHDYATSIKSFSLSCFVIIINNYVVTNTEEISLVDKGKRQTVWLPEKLNEKAEDIRQVLGLSKSGFYRFAIVEIIKQYQTKRLKPKERPA
jgi:hypothetical protein